MSWNGTMACRKSGMLEQNIQTAAPQVLLAVVPREEDATVLEAELHSDVYSRLSYVA
jgi:hypothetical protein